MFVFRMSCVIHSFRLKIIMFKRNSILFWVSFELVCEIKTYKQLKDLDALNHLETKKSFHSFSNFFKILMDRGNHDELSFKS